LRRSAIWPGKRNLDRSTFFRSGSLLIQPLTRCPCAQKGWDGRKFPGWPSRPAEDAASALQEAVVGQSELRREGLHTGTEAIAPGKA
jgi:hypothetical protein